MWTFGGVRIYVTDMEDTYKMVVARLQPFGGGTTIQRFGYEDPIFKVVAKVVGSTNLDTITQMVAYRDYQALIQYDDSMTEVFNESLLPVNIVVTRDNSVYQTIDPTQDCRAPVYTITMELHL